MGHTQKLLDAGSDPTQRFMNLPRAFQSFERLPEEWVTRAPEAKAVAALVEHVLFLWAL
jgi:hypothetical protein